MKSRIMRINLLMGHVHKTPKYTYIAEKTNLGHWIVWRYPTGQERLIEPMAGFYDFNEFRKEMLKNDC